MEAQNISQVGEVQLLVSETKAIEARTFMLQGTLKPENSGGIKEAIENAVTPFVWASGTPGHS